MNQRIPHAILRLALAGVLLTVGCGPVEDGAPIGTGIVTRVIGNVVDAPGPVDVSIDEVASVMSTTDGEGNFELEGDFSGDVTLRFTTADYEVIEPLTVPASSSLVLSDIEISEGEVEVQSALQLGFAGKVQRVDCEAGTMQVVDPLTSTTPYRVQIDSRTTFSRASDDAPASCADVAQGSGVIVDGFADADVKRSLVALRIAVGGDREPGPHEPDYALPLSGNVVAVNCERRAVHIANDVSRTRLRLDSSTSVTDPTGTPLECPAIRMGDRITGDGVFEIDRPGSIRAVSLVVSEESDQPRLRFVGDLTAIDCATGALTVEYQRALTYLRIISTTSFEDVASCAQLALGDRISGTGRVRASHPGEIEASRITLKRPADE